MCILAESLPESKRFVAALGLPARSAALVLRWLAALVGHLGTMTGVSVATVVRTQPRHRAQSGRFLGRRFWQRVDLLGAAQRLLLSLESRLGTFLFIVDQTLVSRQGQHGENTLCWANHGTKRRKRSTRTPRRGHIFVAGLLLTPSGRRIPFLRCHYTRAYCQRTGQPYRTQAERAAAMIRTVPLPDTARVVVLGDTSFDAAVIRQACAARHYTWIVPSNPERVLAGPPGQRPKLWSLASAVDAGALTAVTVSPHQGRYTRQRRAARCRRGPSTASRTYYVHAERRTVHSVGAVRLVFSTTHRPTADHALVFEKLLLTNDLRLPVREVVELYTLRWQIEQFFKEVKSGLGLDRYRCREFAQVEAWVTLTLVAFAYLEWHRARQLQRRLSPARQAWWTDQRTAGLCCAVRQAADVAELDWLRSRLRTPGGMRRLKRLLGPPARAA